MLDLSALQQFAPNGLDDLSLDTVILVVFSTFMILKGKWSELGMPKQRAVEM